MVAKHSPYSPCFVVMVHNKRFRRVANSALFVGHLQVLKRFVAYDAFMLAPACVAAIPSAANAAPAVEPGFCLAVRRKMLRVRDLNYFAPRAKLGRGKHVNTSTREEIY